MADTKFTSLAALLAASVAGNIYLSTDGETFEKVTLAPAPITDAMLLSAPEACLDAIKMWGDDPHCALITAYYPIGGKVVYPETKVYAEDGTEVPPSLSEMRALNFTQREVWACNNAVMPDSIQDCLNALEPIEAAAQE